MREGTEHVFMVTLLNARCWAPPVRPAFRGAVCVDICIRSGVLSFFSSVETEIRRACKSASRGSRPAGAHCLHSFFQTKPLPRLGIMSKMWIHALTLTGSERWGDLPKVLQPEICVSWTRVFICRFLDHCQFCCPGQVAPGVKWGK